MTPPRRIAVYGGSFDPLHHGHIDIIQRGLHLFDEVLVAAARNLSKRPLFTLEERLEHVRQTFADEPRVRVDTFEGLLVRFAEARGACALLRGVRSSTDLDYEAQLARMNRDLAPRLETVLLLTNPHLAHLSSSLIKEVAALGGPIQHTLPEHIHRVLLQRYPQETPA